MSHDFSSYGRLEIAFPQISSPTIYKPRVISIPKIRNFSHFKNSSITFLLIINLSIRGSVPTINFFSSQIIYLLLLSLERDAFFATIVNFVCRSNSVLPLYSKYKINIPSQICLQSSPKKKKHT